MASLQTLPAVAEKILSLFTAELTAQGVTVPSRRYVTPGGLIPWDTDQLTVSLMSVDQGQPGIGDTTTMIPQAVVFYASYSVNLIRAIPVVNTEGFAGTQLPTAAELDESGQQLQTDAGALLLAAAAIHIGYTLTDPGQGFVIGPLQPVGPEGGLAGSRLMLTISLS